MSHNARRYLRTPSGQYAVVEPTLGAGARLAAADANPGLSLRYTFARQPGDVAGYAFRAGRVRDVRTFPTRAAAVAFAAHIGLDVDAYGICTWRKPR